MKYIHRLYKTKRISVSTIVHSNGSYLIKSLLFKNSSFSLLKINKSNKYPFVFIYENFWDVIKITKINEIENALIK